MASVLYCDGWPVPVFACANHTWHPSRSAEALYQQLPVKDMDGVMVIHNPVGPSVPGPAGAWLDQGWCTGADGHRLSQGTMNALLGAIVIGLIRHRRA